MRQRGLEGVGTTEKVDVHDPAQLLRVEVLDLGVDRHHHRGDERVDPAEALDRADAECLELRLARRVRSDGHPLGARRLDLANRGLERLGVPRGDDEPRAAPSRSPRSPARSRWTRPARRRRRRAAGQCRSAWRRTTGTARATPAGAGFATMAGSPQRGRSRIPILSRTTPRLSISMSCTAGMGRTRPKVTPAPTTVGISRGC